MAARLWQLYGARTNRTNKEFDMLKKTIAVATLVSAATLVPTAAQAAGPQANCPKGFEPAPLSILGTDFSGQADQNGDQIVCIRFVDHGRGIFVDNTVR
jgi:hypothetical protein